MKCHKDDKAVHDTPNSNTEPISKQELNDSSQSQAAGSTKGELKAIKC